MLRIETRNLAGSPTKTSSVTDFVSCSLAKANAFDTGFRNQNFRVRDLQLVSLISELDSWSDYTNVSYTDSWCHARAASLCTTDLARGLVSFISLLTGSIVCYRENHWAQTRSWLGRLWVLPNTNSVTNSVRDVLPDYLYPSGGAGGLSVIADVCGISSGLRVLGYFCC